MKMLTADKKHLRTQIKDLLNSNIKERSKSGVHNLLGEILDGLEDKECIVINIGREK